LGQNDHWKNIELFQKVFQDGKIKNSYRGLVSVMNKDPTRNYSQCDSTLKFIQCKHVSNYFCSEFDKQHEASTQKIGEEIKFFTLQRGPFRKKSSWLN
jgi:Fe-S cluster assembly scaffold protein SufB